MGFEPRNFESRPSALPTQPPTLMVERGQNKPSHQITRQVRRSCKLILTKQSLSTSKVRLHTFLAHCQTQGINNNTSPVSCLNLINGVGDPTCRAYRHFHSRKQQSRPSFLNGKLCHTSKNKLPELLSLL